MPDTGDIITIDERRFLLREVIGAGGFGVVFAAREVDQTGRAMAPDVAVKLVDRIKMAEHCKIHVDGPRSAHKHFIEGLEGEIAVLRTLQARYGDLHKIRVVNPIHAGTMEFDDERGRGFPALVLERCPMSLAHILGNGSGPCQDARRRLLTQEGILAFLEDMAVAIVGIAAASGERRLVHRDIKPSNILLARGGGAFLLTDFGNAKEFDDPLTFSIGGITENYAAPEFLGAAMRRAGDGSGGAERVSLLRVDIFSLGMTAIRVLTGGIPWRQADRHVCGATDLLGDHRVKLRAAIAALPVLADIDDDGTVVPWQRPGRGAVSAFRAELEALVLDMVRIDPDTRPDGPGLLRRVRGIREQRRAPPKRRAPRPIADAPPPPADAPRIAPGAIAGSRPGPGRARGLRGGSAAAGLVLLAAVSASAAAVALPEPEVSLTPVAPLVVPGPARWSGRSQDYVRPLCANKAGPSLAAGERIVADVAAVARWPAAAPMVTATIQADGGGAGSASCRAKDAAGQKWQCVGVPDGISGTARMVVTALGAKTPVIVPFHVLPQGSRCPADGAAGVARTIQADYKISPVAAAQPSR